MWQVGDYGLLIRRSPSGDWHLLLRSSLAAPDVNQSYWIQRNRDILMTTFPTLRSARDGIEALVDIDPPYLDKTAVSIRELKPVGPRHRRFTNANGTRIDIIWNERHRSWGLVLSGQATPFIYADTLREACRILGRAR